MKKRILSLLLALCLLLGCMPVTGVSAAETSGSCGDNATWSFDEATGTLTISGTGAIDDYETITDAPWFHALRTFNSVMIEDGITRIGACNFRTYTNLTSIILPDSLTEIGLAAFEV